MGNNHFVVNLLKTFIFNIYKKREDWRETLLLLDNNDLPVFYEHVSLYLIANSKYSRKYHA